MAQFLHDRALMNPGVDSDSAARFTTSCEFNNWSSSERRS